MADGAPASVPTRYGADYAKRAAGCKGKNCKQKLTAGMLRMFKVMFNPFIEAKEDKPPAEMKQYFCPECLFDSFKRARPTTKVVEGPGDIEGWGDLKDEDKKQILKLIEDLEEAREAKAGGKKSPAKKAPAKDDISPSKKSDVAPAKKAPAKDDISPSKKSDVAPAKKATKKRTQKESTPQPLKKNKKKAKQEDDSGEDESGREKSEQENTAKFDQFARFCKLCETISAHSKYTDKSAAVREFVFDEKYDGDAVLLSRLLLPMTDQRVFNAKEKSIIKFFAQIFSVPEEELSEAYKQSGDVSQTVKELVERERPGMPKSNWSIHKVDRWLNRLTKLSGEDEQRSHFSFVAKRLSPLELQYLLRLVKKDLRMNAGAKHILDGLHQNAYEMFQNCRDLEDVVKRCLKGELEGGEDGNGGDGLSISIKLGIPVKPMLAEACKSVEQAMRRCTNGMFAEIKYDGERVQLHKKGKKFSFFSRSLRPVQPHKVKELEKFFNEAFPQGGDFILDAEVLMVDTKTGKPLPFGTLGVHKRNAFKSACVCLFVFDCLLYDDQSLMNKTLEERKKILEDNMTEVPNRILRSNYQDKAKLKHMIREAIDEGLEGLVLKDVKSVYEPGKRHWLKVKKDYLEEGKMADTADLLLLGAYYGTGSKGGIMSVFLMGVRDSQGVYRTVTKCGNGLTDAELEKLNRRLKDKMRHIANNYDQLPAWLRCNRSLVPDFVITDPKEAPVWEITGAEFSKSDKHTADGISIRFPRVTRQRDDKDWQTATSLDELKHLYETSKEKSDFGARGKDVDEEEEEEEEFSQPLYAKEDSEKGVKKEEKSQMAGTTEPLQKTTPTKEVKKEEERSDEDEEIVLVRKKRKKVESSDNEEEEEQSKRMCKYGTQCYRKNPDHLREFVHPHKKTED